MVKIAPVRPTAKDGPTVRHVFPSTTAGIRKPIVSFFQKNSLQVPVFRRDLFLQEDRSDFWITVPAPVERANSIPPGWREYLKNYPLLSLLTYSLVWRQWMTQECTV